MIYLRHLFSLTAVANLKLDSNIFFLHKTRVLNNKQIHVSTRTLNTETHSHY